MAPKTSIPRLPFPALAQTAALVFSPRLVYGSKHSTFELKIVRDVPWVLTSNPENIKTILALKPSDFRSGLSVLRPLTGKNSLLVLSGDEHNRQRKMIVPAFHGSRVALYPKIVEEATLRQLDRMPVGKKFSIRPYLGEITLDVILRAVIGEDHDGDLREPLARWFRYLERPSTMALPTLMGHRNVIVRRIREREQAPLDRALYALIDRRLYEDGYFAPRPDVLSMLIESGLDREEIRDELVTLILAGQETTATALAWAMERLVRNPTEMERLCKDPDYAPLVVKETLRARSVGPAVTRKLQRDLELEEGTVKAGCKVGLNLHAIHHDEQTYPDAATFDPSRFETPPPAHSWLPFGGGARRCAGVEFAQMEMAVVLRTLFKSATFEATTDRAERMKRRFITIAPSQGGKVEIRSKS